MSNHDGRFLKTFVSVLLNLMGIFKSRKYSIIVSTIYTISLIYCLFGTIIGFLTASGTSNKITTMTTSLLIFAGSFIYFIVFSSRYKIQNLLRILRGDGTDISDVIDLTGKFVKNKIILLVFIYVFLAICFATQTLIFSSTYDEIPEEFLSVIPFWYSCGKGEIHKVLQILCWKTESQVEIIFINTLQVLLSGLIYTVYCFGGLMYSIIIAELHMHTNCFKLEVVKLVKYMNLYAIRRDSSKNPSTKVSKAQYEEALNYQFVKIIRYQSFLKRCAREVIAAFEYFINFFIFEFFADGILLIFLMFDKAENKLLLHKCFECCFHGLLSFSMLCYYSQMISDLNRVIFHEIMQIPWYEQDLKFRKLYINVLIQNQIPVEMKFFNTLPLNFEFFLVTLKSAYSILNLMFLKFGK